MTNVTDVHEINTYGNSQCLFPFFCQKEKRKSVKRLRIHYIIDMKTDMPNYVRSKQKFVLRLAMR